MDSPFISMILPWPTTYAPYQWSYCAGQQTSVTQNQALYALLGNIYGGDSQGTYFNLPDLRGRVIIGSTDMGGIPSWVSGAYPLASTGGIEINELTSDKLPFHTHGATAQATANATGTLASISASGNLPVSTKLASSPSPGSGNVPALLTPVAGTGDQVDAYGPTDGTTIPVDVNVTAGQVNIALNNMSVNVQVGAAGSQGAALDNRSPYIALSYIIAMMGYYPTRQ